MIESVVEIDTDSLEEARAQIDGRIPEGGLLLSEEVLCDGQPVQTASRRHGRAQRAVRDSDSRRRQSAASNRAHVGWRTQDSRPRLHRDAPVGRHCQTRVVLVAAAGCSEGTAEARLSRLQHHAVPCGRPGIPRRGSSSGIATASMNRKSRRPCRPWAPNPTCATIVQVPHLGGLHHYYERRAA